MLNNQLKFLLIAGYPKSILNFRGKLIEALQSNGIEVHVAAPNFPVDSKIRIQLENKSVIVHEITLHRTGLNPLFDIVTLFQLIQVMRKIRPDYVLGYTAKPVIYGSIAAKITRVPNCFALITGLGYGFTNHSVGTRRIIRKVLIIMYRSSLRGIDKVFFQNIDDRNVFSSLEILNSSCPVVVINGSGVDLNYYSMVPVPQKVSFLLIARLLGDKGVREYANAAKQIKEKYPDVEFVLVGWLDENPDAINRVELHKWIDAGVLLYLGEMSDVRPAIEDCSVYVLPSCREGIPRTVLESMAMGRAVITSNAPGCRETVVDGENGFLVSVKSVNSLKSAMMKFIENPALCVSMGRCSRVMAESKYDVHKVNATLLKEMGIE